MARWWWSPRKNSLEKKGSSWRFFARAVLLLMFQARTPLEVRGEGTTSTSTDARLDVCALNLLDNVNGTSNALFNSRLEGLTLSVAAIWDPGYVSIEGEAAPTRMRDYPDVYCTDCGSRLSGYNFDVFEKMASIGNFKTNWTIFGDVDSTRGETYEQMALNFTRDFDVSGQ